MMRGSGFTLIEVLIALAIVAVGLSAAVRATTQVTSAAEDMKARTFAVWIAQDRLAEHAARRTWPNPGVSQGTAGQAHLQFVWRESIADTAVPFLRTVEVTVATAAQPEHVLARLVGLAAMPPRNP